MSALPITPAHPTADTSRHQDVLNRFIDFGDRLVQLAIERAEAAELPVEKAAASYDRVTRSVRKSIWLVRKLAAEPSERLAARKRIIRVVEDAIQCHADPFEADDLHEELRDRLDTPDLEHEIAARPVEDIITDITRDLGLAHIPGTHPWKRRTPADLSDLQNQAARHTTKPARRNPEPARFDPEPARRNADPVGCNSS